MVSIQQSSKITMNKLRVKINLALYFVVNFMIIMVILVFFMVISVNRRLFRYFGSYSGISVITVILVNRRTVFSIPLKVGSGKQKKSFQTGPSLLSF